MIEKEPGNPRIHRLQVIHLYEADYHLMLSLFWARIIFPQAEQLWLFNSSCYGSRPDLSVVDQVLLEELQVLIAYLSQKINQVTFHNDAMSCYNCIIISLANLVAHRFGRPEEIWKLQGVTLEKMQYSVSTALGIADRSYSHLEESPIYGMGQVRCVSRWYGYRFVPYYSIVTTKEATAQSMSLQMDQSSSK
jgi:hypothetical protein